MGSARSSVACVRSAGGRNRARDSPASTPSTRGSVTPCAWTRRAIAAPGAGSGFGSGGLGGRAMVARLVELEILHLELDLAPVVPLVDRRREHQGADRV